jgi:hypothetical protein
VTDLSTLIPHLATLPDQDEALGRLHAAWRGTPDPAGFALAAQGALAYPGHHPMVPLVLRLAAMIPDLDVAAVLLTRWDRWSELDLPTREALAAAVARRAHQGSDWLQLMKDAVLERPELGERLVPLFLAAPVWFADHSATIFAAYPHAKAAIAAAGQLLLASLGDRAPAPPPERSESRVLLGKLLDYDAAEVFDKLDAMLDASPELGEPLIHEMAARSMDLRGVVAALRERVERDAIKGWVLGAVPDELERLVYLAMI